MPETQPAADNPVSRAIQKNKETSRCDPFTPPQVDGVIGSEMEPSDPVRPLVRAAGWMKFLGVIVVLVGGLLIVMTGVQMVLSQWPRSGSRAAPLTWFFWGFNIGRLVFAGIQIRLGLLLLGAGIGYSSSRLNRTVQCQAAERLRRYFRLMSIMVMIILILLAIPFVAKMW